MLGDAVEEFRMSWLSRLTPSRSSVNRANQTRAPPTPVPADPETCLMVFQNHWRQVSVVLDGQHSRGCGLSDDLTAVLSHTDQMMCLLVGEQGVGGAPGPILQCVLAENVLERLLQWHLGRGLDFHSQGALLRLFELLLGQAQQPLLQHGAVLQPLLRLLGSCVSPLGACPTTLEPSLVLLLNQVCVSLAQQPTTLEIMLQDPPPHASQSPAPNHSHGPASTSQSPNHSHGPASTSQSPNHSHGPASTSQSPNHSHGPASTSQSPNHSHGPASTSQSPNHSHGLFLDTEGPTPLLVFSLLVPFIHREGILGQQARDALLLVMATTSKNQAVASYIANNSYFCPVLATGLSALYSSLPRKIEARGDDWHALRPEDWVGVSSLVLFMNSLEFCNAVVQVAHPLLQSQLLQYLHTGFLVPVMGPALHKSSAEEMIASTAYLDLFLRSITETALLKTFLRFILLYRHDNDTILDTMITRISSNSRLCMVSLSLFHTLLSLHCEDVILQLVLRYLVPCTHVMISQRRAVRDTDMYGKSAEKFLSLIPECCRMEAASSTDQGDESASWEKGLSSPSDYSAKPSAASRRGLLIQHESGDGGAPPDRTLPAAPEGLDGDWGFLGYLRDARRGIELCSWGCRDWSAPYDGQDPSPNFATLPPPPPTAAPTLRMVPEHFSLHPVTASSPISSHSSLNSSDSAQCSTNPAHNDTDSAQCSTNQAHNDTDSAQCSTNPTHNDTDSAQCSTNPTHNDTDSAQCNTNPTHNDTDSAQCNTNPAHNDTDSAQCSTNPAHNDTDSAQCNTNRAHNDTDSAQCSTNPAHNDTDSAQCNTNRAHNDTDSAQCSTNPTHNDTDSAQCSTNPTHNDTDSAQCSTNRAHNDTDSAQCSTNPTHNDTDSAQCSTNRAHNDTDSAQNRSNPTPKEDAIGSSYKSNDMPLMQQQDGGMEVNRVRRDGRESCLLQGGLAQGSHSQSTLSTPAALLTETLGLKVKCFQGPDVTQSVGPTPISPSSALLSGPTPTTDPSTNSTLQSIFNKYPSHSGTPPLGSAPTPDSSPNPTAAVWGRGLEWADRLMEELLERGGPLARWGVEAGGQGISIEAFEQELSQLEEWVQEKRSVLCPLEEPRCDLPTPDPCRQAEELAQKTESSAKEAVGSVWPLSAPPTQPYTGPFMTALLAKLQCMLQNSLYVNIQLTGILTQLACYPQPLLRSFLLNTNMVFQPSVKSLLQVLGSVRNQIEAFAAVQGDFPAMLRKARRYLFARGKLDWADPPGMGVPNLRRSYSLIRSRKPSLGELLLRHTKSPSRVRHTAQQALAHAWDGSQSLHSTLSPGGNEALRVKNVVYSAVVFSEFLMELAALAQEHSVALPFPHSQGAAE
ncbi:hypothetical protein AGOR_G00057710 [Albula goreensis]|uniref:FHF complex subunit HOOK-interacting protein 1B n=1 Tax=Albula goreensis TaxID=1534307 RepID=A0A8T3DQY5_9TELE|nr:hypothetical protein AGOR_G00057710 [Albula goreensis]